MATLSTLFDSDPRSATLPVSSTGSNAYLQRLSGFTQESALAGNRALISLFCGGGGLDLGLNLAGFATKVCSDLSPSFVDSVVHNLPHAVGIAEDAMKLSGEHLCELARTTEIDLMAAGPPCQSFSILGRRGALDDPRGKLALKYFDLVSEVRPKAFIFENVPGLLSVNEGRDWKLVYKYAEEMTGYTLHVDRAGGPIMGCPVHDSFTVMSGIRVPTQPQPAIKATTSKGHDFSRANKSS